MRRSLRNGHELAQTSRKSTHVSWRESKREREALQRLRRDTNETEAMDMNNNTTELVTDMMTNSTDTTEMMSELGSTTQVNFNFFISFL